MKVSFKHMVGGYTGKADGIIYYLDRQTGKIYTRRMPNRKEDATNRNFKSIMNNLFKLHPDYYYKQDWQMYVGYYNAVPANHNNPVKAWNNLWMKVLFAMADNMPGIDLHTLTKQQIIEQNLPCISLKRAVETGYLPETLGYERFDHMI